MSTNISGRQPSYPMDAENMAEMARLIKQAHLMTEHLGLFPPAIDLAHKRRLLDIGCGPGEWVFEMARQLQEIQIVGVDISETMINYANTYASIEEIVNVSFEVMDVRAPLKFSEHAFDVIHARFLSSFLSPTAWPALLSEYYRLLRPGGLVCSTEFENMGIVTTPSLAHFNRLILQALHQTGQCFTQEGEMMGITAVQARLLRDAGFQRIQQKAHVINYSMGMPAHEVMLENWRTVLQLIQPLLLRLNLATQEELGVLYERSLEEMEHDDFCAVIFYQTVWGEKPA